MHSKDFEELKRQYGLGKLTIEDIRNAVLQTKITVFEYREITGYFFKE